MSTYRLISRNALDDMASSILRGFISYVSQLYSDGEISERTYQTLMKQAIAEYINETVEEKVERVVETQIVNSVTKVIANKLD